MAVENIDKVEQKRTATALGSLEVVEDDKTPEQIAQEEKDKEEADAAADAAAKAAAENNDGNPNPEGDGSDAGNGNSGGGEEEDEEEEEEHAAGYIATKYGIANLDLTGKDPNSVEVIDEIYNKEVIPAKKVEAIKELFEAVPPVKSLFEHLQKGYGIESWNKLQAPDVWANFKIKEKDEVAATTAYTEAGKIKGLSDKQINRNISAAKDEGTFFEEADEELKFLRGYEKKGKEDILLAEQKAIEDEIEAKNKLWTEVERITSSGKFAGIMLPEAEAKEFYNKIAFRGKDGKQPTQIEKYYNEITTEEELALDWFFTILKEKKFDKIKGLFKPDVKAGIKVRVGAKVNNGVGQNDSTGTELTVQGFNDIINKAKKTNK